MITSNYWVLFIMALFTLEYGFEASRYCCESCQTSSYWTVHLMSDLAIVISNNACVALLCLHFLTSSFVLISSSYDDALLCRVAFCVIWPSANSSKFSWLTEKKKVLRDACWLRISLIQMNTIVGVQHGFQKHIVHECPTKADV